MLGEALVDGEKSKSKRLASLQCHPFSVKTAQRRGTLHWGACPSIEEDTLKTSRWASVGFKPGVGVRSWCQTSSGTGLLPRPPVLYGILRLYRWENLTELWEHFKSRLVRRLTSHLLRRL